MFQWKTVRVFISSTFRDMHAERDHLVRFVFPRLREELLKHRIHLIDVDLRWGVTSDQDALGVCREVIDECHPRFIGMLGGRYGWVPKGYDKSITADEIHYGVLSREAEERGNAFLYFRDPNSTADIIEETPGEHREIEGSDAAIKLAALKQTITDAGLPVFIYPAHWDPTQKRLIRLDVFGDKVFTDLLQSFMNDTELAGRFSSDGTTTPDEFQEEAEQMEAFIEERTERYVIGSREPLLKEMTAFANAVGNPNIFVLSGEPGSGKSSLLAKLTRDLFSLYPSCFILSHFVGASSGSTDLRRTLRRLCHELARAAGSTESLPLDIKDLIIHFQKLLTETASKQRVILVFDALNQFDSTDGAHYLHWLPRELPPSLRIVASTLEHSVLHVMERRGDSVRIVKVDPFTKEDALAIIQGYLQRYAKRFSQAQLDSLLAKSGSRLPLYVLTALEELRTLGTYEEITTRIRDLPGESLSLFGWILTERLANDPSFRDREGRLCGAALVEQFAACLGVSRRGLSPAELTALLDPGDPLGNVAALLRLLRPYLMRRGELLDFYHSQFREAAEAAHLDTPEKQRTAHQSVATCLQAFADPHRDGQCRDATPHALSELPHHQTRAEAWPDIIATLENIFFLEAKVTHGMAFDLAEDFTATVGTMPSEHVEREHLRLLNEALRRDIHFIVRHTQDYPQALFQCLWNSAWWFDCPEADQHYDENAIHQPGNLPKLHKVLEAWREKRQTIRPDEVWLRNARPPSLQLGTGLIGLLCGHSGSVSCLAVSKDDKYIASGSDDQSVKVWDAETQQLVVALPLSGGGRVRCVVFDPRGESLFTADANTVKQWSLPLGSPMAEFHGQKGPFNCLAISPDGRTLVTGGQNGDVRLWDVTQRASIQIIMSANGMAAVRSLAFSPDGVLLAVGRDDGTIQHWETNSQCMRLSWIGHEKPVISLAFARFGIGFGSASASNAKIWSDGTTQDKITVDLSGDSVVVFSPDLRAIAVGCYQKVECWDMATGKSSQTLKCFGSAFESLAWGKAGKILFGGNSDNTITAWDLSKALNTRTLRAHRMAITDMAFSPDGKLLATGSYDKTVKLWEVASGRERVTLYGNSSPALCLAFSPNNHLLAVGCGNNLLLLGNNDNTIRLWALDRIDTEKQPVSTCQGHTASVRDIVFSPDSRTLASGSMDKTVVLWDVLTGDRKATLDGTIQYVMDRSVNCVAFSPTGEDIASGSEGGTVRLWDVYTHRMHTVLRHLGDVSGVGFAPDGRTLATSWGNYRKPQGIAMTDLEHRKRTNTTEELLACDIVSAMGWPSFPGAVPGPSFHHRRDGETVIAFTEGGHPDDAFYPATIITTHPNGRMFAGRYHLDTNVHIVVLEGRPGLQR